MAKKQTNFNKIVEITWVDAEEHGIVGWNDLEEMKEYAKSAPPTIKSVGYVVFENSEHISIVSSIGPDICGTMEKIPTTFIKDIKEL